MKRTAQIVSQALFAFVISFYFAGCQGSGESHEHIVNYHKPSDFVEAITRLEEIHAALVSSDPLPSDREFVPDDYHSHSHDHDDGSHGHSHDHSDDIVKVSIFQELNDIVRWLPTIAADSDLPKKSWDAIAVQSKSLTNLMAKIRGKDASTKRKQYQQHSEQFKEVLLSLRDLVKDFEFWDEKFPG